MQTRASCLAYKKDSQLSISSDGACVSSGLAGRVWLVDKARLQVSTMSAPKDSQLHIHWHMLCWQSGSSSKTRLGVQGMAQGVGLSFWELMDFIVAESPPQLSPGEWSPEFCHFLDCCLQKVRSCSTCCVHP